MATSSVEARSDSDGAPLTPQLSALLADLQSRGLRVEEPVEARQPAGSAGAALEARRGGAGPADAGMLWVEGVAVTVPVAAPFVAGSPYLLRPEAEDEYAIYRDGERVASARRTTRPRYYDLTTEDGIPYWQIALLHLDSVASTVIQTCMYWDTADVCQFCGIELSLRAGRTIPVKRPEHLAEVAVAARDLDGAVDATLTTGTTHGHDKGATYIGRCAQAIKQASGLPVEVQFEPPDDLEVLDQVHEMGADSVGMHVESFDPEVLGRIAPAKARTGIEGYFRAWEHAVEVFGRGQVSTYVILGMGEDADQTVAGCRRAIDLGVYPFVVPLRPVPGTPLGDVLPPDPEYMESVYRRVVPYLVARGLGSWNVRAGCARCQACSAMTAMERSLGHDGRASLPLLEIR
ncbi:MAG TPA: MSMEG_0568 family radical SAM protein [Actinomycetes bacterium]|jgi:radical SAM protein (TIGR04043 family)|nr:MSMEG_0568 family radical SAM protein [Actinomycetes bacterium]